MKIHFTKPNVSVTVCGLHYLGKWQLWAFTTNKWIEVTCKRCLESKHPAAEHQRALLDNER